jgi:hypothetical protein
MKRKRSTFGSARSRYGGVGQPRREPPAEDQTQYRLAVNYPNGMDITMRFVRGDIDGAFGLFRETFQLSDYQRIVLYDYDPDTGTATFSVEGSDERHTVEGCGTFILFTSLGDAAMKDWDYDPKGWIDIVAGALMAKRGEHRHD